MFKQMINSTKIEEITAFKETDNNIVKTTLMRIKGKIPKFMICE